MPLDLAVAVAAVVLAFAFIGGIVWVVSRSAPEGRLARMLKALAEAAPPADTAAPPADTTAPPADSDAQPAAGATPPEEAVALSRPGRRAPQATWGVLDWWYPQYDRALREEGGADALGIRGFPLKTFEDDLSAILGEVEAAELPVNIFFREMSRIPDLRILGVAMDTGPKPTRLLGAGEVRDLSQHHLCEVLSGVSVGVLGRYMTPTLMLLTYLRAQGVACAIPPEGSPSAPSGAPDRPQEARLPIYYSADEQLEALRSRQVDYTWCVLQADGQLPNGLSVIKHDEQGWFDWGDAAWPVPASVVVVHEEMLAPRNKDRVKEILARIEWKNGAMAGLGNGGSDASYRGGVGVEVRSGIAFRSDVPIRDPHEQATLLEVASTRFFQAGDYPQPSFEQLLGRINEWAD